MKTNVQRRRVLVIDDNDAIHGDFRKTLESRTPTERLANAAALLFGSATKAAHGGPEFEVDCASQGREGFEKVRASVTEGKPYALAFVDMRMPPGWDGVETVKHLWEADADLQVVICTAYSDYSWEQIVEELGTTDRLLILKKPFDPIEVCQLAAALSEKWKLKHEASLKMADLERMVHERTTELHGMAMTDKLTGLPNRANLMEHLMAALVKSQADASQKFAVLFIDFDRFKVINDSLGHKAGDQLLVGIAGRLREILGLGKPGSEGNGRFFAARLGGDEFVIVQQGIKDLSETTTLAEKLVETLGKPYTIEGVEVRSTASIGIAGSEFGYQWSDDILRDADSAMYSAKSLGRARYALFSPEMHEKAMHRITMESDLRRAMERGELALHYQPIMDLGDGKLLGFEALLRWKHPERGMIAPAEFIPVAEETGMIMEIGKWVLRTAAMQMAEWTRQYPEAAELEISVNCSCRQLKDPHFVKAVEDILAASGLEPRRLNLEITESIMVDNLAATIELLTQLRTIGVGLQMDDFGTGYSSLHSLHGLPLNVLKIDQSFIRNVSMRRDYAAVINAIISLAHNLGMKVIGEGVESPEHVATLSCLDCDAAQGYLFSKPMNVGDAAKYMLEGKAGASRLSPGQMQSA